MFLMILFALGIDEYVIDEHNHKFVEDVFQNTLNVLTILNAPWPTCDQKFKAGIVNPDRSTYNIRVYPYKVDGDLKTTTKFVDALRIPYIAPSFGGCESIVAQPALMGFSQLDRAKYGIVDNLVRFSFGIEDIEDLKTDVLQAFEAI
ncbi:cystathionine gamma-synthase 1, chloroplastic-like protein [Tanacetum coccineum]